MPSGFQSLGAGIVYALRYSSSGAGIDYPSRFSKVRVPELLFPPGVHNLGPGIVNFFRYFNCGGYLFYEVCFNCLFLCSLSLKAKNACVPYCVF
jgi:hypothetical protein